MNKNNRNDIPYIYDELSNFREIRTSGIGRGILYRSSHPLNEYDSTGTKSISRFAQKAGINCVLNLDDDTSVLKTKAAGVPWYHKLVTAKQVTGLNMTLELPSAYCNQKLKKGLRFMIAHNGPYLIHCYAGIDRTGFVAAVLEALMGASLREIVEDYQLSFGSGYNSAYSGDEQETDGLEIEAPYNGARILRQLNTLCNEIALSEKNIQLIVEQYLLGALELSNDELAQLKLRLTAHECHVEGHV